MWIWASMAPECRMVLSHAVGERNQMMTKDIVAKTAKRLACTPLFVTDGLKFYTKALLEQYCQWVKYPPTGKRGRPRKDRLIPNEKLKYAQVIKNRNEGRLKEVFKKILFGKDVDAKLISTSLIERLNLTLRQDNNRISRKTIGFSKKIEGLRKQMNLYFAYYNFCRGHRSLKQFNEDDRIEISAPAKYGGLIDCNWTLRELLTFSHCKIPTN